MGYNKKSLADFKKDLDSGLYQTATGARRAVGKFAEWKEAERDKARKLIDTAFGEGATTAPAKASKKKAGKKKVAKASKKASGKKKAKKKPNPNARPLKGAASATEAAPAVEAAPAKKAAKKASKKTAKRAAPKAAPKASEKQATSASPIDTEMDNLKAVEYAIANCKEIRGIDDSFDVSSVLAEARDAVRESLKRLRGISGGSSNGAPKEPVVSPAVEPTALPGLSGMPFQQPPLS